MKRLLAVWLFLTALPQAWAATVAPSFAVSGTVMRLTLTRPLAAGEPLIFVGGHRAQGVQGKGKTWDFPFPGQVLPGPQPVRVALNGQARQAQVVGWVEALQGSSGILTVVSRQGPGASPWTPAVLSRLIVSRVNASLQLNTYSAGYLNVLKGLQLKDLPITALLDRSSYRVNVPVALLEELQQWKSRGGPTPPRPLLDGLRQQLPVGVRVEELAAALKNGQGTVPNALMPGLSYRLQLEPQQPPGAAGQRGATLAFVPTTAPNVNVRLPPVSLATTSAVCAQPHLQIKATGEQMAIVADLLYREKAVALDPTGYGIPSQAPAGSGVNATLASTGILSAAGARLNGAAAGRGVKVYVVDSGLSRAAPAGQSQAQREKRQALASHGVAVARIISDMVPGAQIIQAPACGDDGVCRGDLILQHLCEAARQAHSGPVIVNLSLHLPYRSPALRQALTEATAAGVLVVVAHGNNDRCQGRQSDAPFKDHCNAYPADWTGRPVAGIPYPTDETGAGFRPNPRLFSAGGWDVGGVVKAGFGREGPGTSFVPVTTPTRYLPATFKYALDPAGPAREYNGTSFAAPVLTGLLANWLSFQPPPREGLTPNLLAYQPGQPETQLLRYEWLWHLVPVKK